MPPKREPTNIERFLAATTPTVRGSRLAQLWRFYDVPYGVEVPYYEGTGPVGSAEIPLLAHLRAACPRNPRDDTILYVTAHALRRQPVRIYFVPYLSGMRLLKKTKQDTVCNPVTVKTKTISSWIWLLTISFTHTIICPRGICNTSTESFR